MLTHGGRELRCPIKTEDTWDRVEKALICWSEQQLWEKAMNEGVTICGSGGVGSEEYDKGIFPDFKITRNKNMTFGEALEAMKAGKKVRCASWSNRTYYLYIEEGRVKDTNREDYSQSKEEALSRNVLATDWEVVETDEEKEQKSHEEWLRNKLRNLWLTKEAQDDVYDLVLGKLKKVNREFTTFITSRREEQVSRLEWLKDLIVEAANKIGPGTRPPMDAFNSLLAVAKGNSTTLPKDQWKGKWPEKKLEGCDVGIPQELYKPDIPPEHWYPKPTSFSEALEAMKQGKWVRHADWPTGHSMSIITKGTGDRYVKNADGKICADGSWGIKWKYITTDKWEIVE